MSAVHSERRRRLRELLQREGADGMLVTNESNVRYLTGFSGDSSVLCVGPRDEVLVSDSRYTTQIEEECPGLVLRLRGKAQRPAEAMAEVLGEIGAKDLAFEALAVSWDLRDFLGRELPQLRFHPTRGAIEESLRSIKDEAELGELRCALELAERAFEDLRRTLRPDDRECALAWRLEASIRERGGVGVSFAPIVAVGDRAALPHYRSGDRRVDESPLLLVDWGARLRSGYVSDLTRVLFPGPPSARMKEVYEVVREAQARAIDAIRPGVACREVDRVARDGIASAGYGDFFGHGLGHGIGLDVHEQPRFEPRSEQVLRPGMVITVEPGIYLPGEFGVRIEDDVLVTPHGGERLSSLPRDLESASCPLGAR